MFYNLTNNNMGKLKQKMIESGVPMGKLESWLKTGKINEMDILAGGKGILGEPVINPWDEVVKKGDRFYAIKYEYDSVMDNLGDVTKDVVGEEVWEVTEDEYVRYHTERMYKEMNTVPF